MYYCSLADVRSEIKANLTAEDGSLLHYVAQISRRIDRLMAARAARPFFGPYQEGRQYPMSSRYFNSDLNTLLLRNAPPLLELTNLTLDGTDVSSAAELYPAGEPLPRAVRINSSGNRWYSYITSSSDPAYASVTGIWGYHSDYSNAWVDTGQDLAAAISDAASTSFTVPNVDADDLDGFAPAISRGMLLKIDSEFLLCIDTNTGTNAVSVKRGVNGSTATTHSIGANIYMWQVEEPIRRITARQAALLYARRGAFEQTQDAQYPVDLLRELEHVVAEYING